MPPSLPSPSSILKSVSSLFRPIPFKDIPQEGDFFGIVIMAGDATKDLRADGRILVLRRGEDGLVGHQIGPAENVPMEEAVDVAQTLAHLLPEPVATGVAIALGGAGAAAKLAQRAVLKG